MQDAPYSDRCWDWPGARHPQGYGWLTVAGRNMMAHRMLYALAHGPIPDDKVVRHKCDNRLCVNPAHLALGTQVDNVADMDARGRRAIGARHGRAKLTDDDVRAIRATVAAGASRSSQARKYGLAVTSVSNIVDRVTWAHVA